MLGPLFRDINRLQSSFSHITFLHVYQDKKNEVDRLSKVVLEMKEGRLNTIEFQQGKLNS
jgi:hypothetical protein